MPTRSARSSTATPSSCSDCSRDSCRIVPKTYFARAGTRRIIAHGRNSGMRDYNERGRPGRSLTSRNDKKGSKSEAWLGFLSASCRVFFRYAVSRPGRTIAQAATPAPRILSTRCAQHKVSQHEPILGSHPVRELVHEEIKYDSDSPAGPELFMHYQP